MPLLADLSQAISAYRRGSVSLDKFEDWFRTASRSMFGESEDVLRACLAIETAFSELGNGEMHEPEFAEELANAIGPFVGTTKPKIAIANLGRADLDQGLLSEPPNKPRPIPLTEPQEISFRFQLPSRQNPIAVFHPVTVPIPGVLVRQALEGSA